jgi:nucleoside 2-deoxyribosyltransferase
MAANDELRALYDEAIGPAVRENALEPFLMVHREPRASIANEILLRIEGARLVVADLTYERPNCYFEVGYAQAKGKKVLFTARRDHDPRRTSRQLGDPKIHFDLDSQRFSYWEHGDWTLLRTELSKRICEALSNLDLISDTSDRLGEKGESEVLTCLQGIQNGKPARVLFYDHFVAQQLGWPLEDVRLVLKRLAEKGWISPLANGYALTRR